MKQGEGKGADNGADKSARAGVEMPPHAWPHGNPRACPRCRAESEGEAGRLLADLAELEGLHGAARGREAWRQLLVLALLHARSEGGMPF